MPKQQPEELSIEALGKTLEEICPLKVVKSSNKKAECYLTYQPDEKGRIELRIYDPKSDELIASYSAASIYRQLKSRNFCWLISDKGPRLHVTIKTYMEKTKPRVCFATDNEWETEKIERSKDQPPSHTITRKA